MSNFSISFLSLRYMSKNVVEGETNEIFCELQVASCQVCVWQLQQFCCQPEVWHRRKVSPRLEKEDWQHKVSAENQMCRSWQEVPVAWAREKGRRMGRGKQKEWARRDKKSDLFARQKNRTTNEYRQFPRLKWVVHSVHEAEQTRAAPENEKQTNSSFRSHQIWEKKWPMLDSFEISFRVK